MAYTPYSPTTWNNDNPPAINETNLNRIEAGIAIINRLTPSAQDTPDMTIKVNGPSIVFFTENPSSFAGGNSPTVTAPTANPRIDLLVLNNSPALEWVTGTEAASPSPPSYPSDKIPICEIYNRVGETSIKNADDATNGYIYRDVRNYINFGVSKLSGLTIDANAALATSLANGGVNEIATALNLAAIPATLTGKDADTLDTKHVTSLSLIGSGSYSGNNTANRAIAHGLGVAPKIVFFYTLSTSYPSRGFLVSDGTNGRIYSQKLDSLTTELSVTVTIWDATNFYVGNAIGYDPTWNGDGWTPIFWVAFA